MPTIISGHFSLCLMINTYMDLFEKNLRESEFDLHYTTLIQESSIVSHLRFGDNAHSQFLDEVIDTIHESVIEEGKVKKGAKPTHGRGENSSIRLTVGDVGLGTSSKLRGIPHWSLNAGVTCPASVCADKRLMPSCQACYAEQGRHVFSKAIELRNYNQADWKKPDWVKRMVKSIRLFSFFRWFESGDVYHPDLAIKIYEIIKKTPQTKHWLPTLSWKLPDIEVFLAKIATLKNVAVRYSSGQIDGTFDKRHGSTIAPHELASKWFHEPETAPTGVMVCPVGVNVVDKYAKKKKDRVQANCDDCFACFDPNSGTVVYALHGNTTRRAKEHEQMAIGVKLSDIIKRRPK